MENSFAKVIQYQDNVQNEDERWHDLRQADNEIQECL